LLKASQPFLGTLKIFAGGKMYFGKFS
jgi:hypothetical protein